MRPVHIIMYHYVRDLVHSRYPEIKALTLDEFIHQVTFLKNSFTLISMDELTEAKLSGSNLPENAAVLTFDDGYSDHFMNVFPVLRNLGISGSFYIPGEAVKEHRLLAVNKIHFILASAGIGTLMEEVISLMDRYRGREFDFPDTSSLINEYRKRSRYDNPDTVFVKKMLQAVLPEKLRNIICDELFKNHVGVKEDVFSRELYLNEHQIRCMREAGMHIGAHGYRHYWLGNLEQGKMKEDIDKGLEVIDPYIDRDKWVMNYPYGSFNEDTVRYISSIGCKLAIATRVGVCDLDKDDPYALPRLNTNDFPPKSEEYKSFSP